MGNEQSVPAPRKGQNRLSKPKTNSTGNVLTVPIPNIPSRETSQSSTSPRRSRYSLFAAESQGEHGDEAKEPRRRRRSLFRSRSSQTKSRMMLDEDPGVPTDFIDPTPVELPVRRYSVLDRNSQMQSTPDQFAQRPKFNARASLPHLPTRTVSAQTSRLSLVQETRPAPLEKVEITRANVEAEAQLTNPKLSSRTNSETTLYGPIRRRSLLQHGVVTRKVGFGANDPRKSLPSQVHNVEHLQDYYYDASRSTSSPLTTLASLGHEIPASSPDERVKTPNDLDYGHIGAYKLGSLRITNGAASPTPSSRDGRPSTSDDDYLTFGARQRGTSHRHGLSQRSYTSPPGETIKPSRVMRAESPLQQSHSIEHAALTIETQMTDLDPSLALFDFRTMHSPSRSLDLAKEYIQDLPLSPFSFDASSQSPSTGEFQVTSKHTALEDDLFEPEPETETEIPPLDRTPSVPRSHDSGYGSTDSPVVVKGPRENLPKPLAKADSGYSSNISLRSFTKDAAAIVPAKDVQVSTIREAGSRVASSTYSVSSMTSEKTMRADQPLPELPTQDIISRLPPSQAPPPPISAENPTICGPEYEKIPPNVPPKTAEQRRGDLKVHKRQQSLPPVPAKMPRFKHTSSGNLFSNTDWKSKNSKVQKRPVSMQPAYTAPVYTIQALQSPNDAYGFPSVPAETERKLTERVGGFPVASFPNTYSNHVGLRKSSSKETLGTIFSVGSAEVRDEVDFARLQGKLPPIPSTIPEYPSVVPERKPTPNRRATFQPSSTNSLPFWKSFNGRGKSFRANPPEPVQKTAEQQDAEFEAHVTSIETIASSLGTSPYDIAIVGRQQSSGGNGRAKSMTSQFETQAAERFQRNRSISQESQLSTMLQSRRSYDSITGGSPSMSGTSTANGAFKAPREHPPSAHSNKTAWKTASGIPFAPPGTIPFSASNGSLVEAGSSSPASRESKQRKPPVSMKTQRQSLPAVLGPRRPPSKSPQPPNRDPPQPPAAQALQKEETSQESQDQWLLQKDFWAARRKSAGEALRTQKSVDFQLPENSGPSLESQQDSRMEYGMGIKRASTTAPDTYKATYKQPAWGYDYQAQQQQRPQPWISQAPSNLQNIPPQWVHRQTSAEYNHTYESSTVPYTQQDEYYRPAADDEYYAQPDINATSQTNIFHDIHSRENSTNEMLVLDRFSGGLGYNYDPSYGLVGSAGSGSGYGGNGALRKGVEASRLYGVDFTDVPVILQRVPANS